jgi:RNA-directed DNA polymerase
VFTTLAPLSEEDFLHEADRPTSTSSAPGIAGVTAQPYAEHLDQPRRDFHERLRGGRSQAAPVERVGIEQAAGGQRPLGTLAFEAKSVQRAGGRRLDAIYEQELYDCAYGARPGRSPHDARHEVGERGMQEGIGGIVEAEVRGYCDSIDRTQLREVLRKRGNDGRLIRLIGKWLRVGVRADGGRHHPESGVVQGGVRSPVLANLFLHQVLEDWCAWEGRPRLRGRCFLLRFADAVCIGCAYAADARQIMAVLPKRCARSGFPIPPEQTTVLAVRKPNTHQAAATGNGTCDGLGWPQYWTRSRRGCWGSTRRTARKRRRRTKKALWRGGRPNRHACTSS